MDKMNIFRTVIRQSFVAVFAIGFCFPAHAESPVLVQSASKEVLKERKINRAAFTTPNTAGNLIVVYHVLDNTDGVTTTDTAGNNYQTCGAKTVFNGGANMAQIDYAANIKAGTNTVQANYLTTTRKPGARFGRMFIHEFSGLDTSNPCLAATSAISTGTSINSGSVTATAKDQLVFGAITSSVGQPTVGSGFTSILSASMGLTQLKLSAASGAVSASATTPSGNNVAHVAVFKQADVVVPPSDNIHISQTAQGTGDGTSCTNARAASYFNTSSNWGTGTGKISAGKTVQLCGTITSNLTFQRSGELGKPITIDGEDAIYSGMITASNLSHWRVQNVTWADGEDDVLMNIVGGSNGVFTNNHADSVSSDPAVWLAQYNGVTLPTDITISNNYIRTTDRNLGNTQLDIIKTEGSKNIIVEGNYLEMRAGGSGSNAHDDVIQTYEKGGSSAGNPTNWTIRHNKIVMNSAATNDRSWLMLESLSGINNIYGNIFLGLKGAEAGNGIAASSNASNLVLNIYNNTFVTKGSASNNVFNLAAPGVANLSNNIIHTANQTTITGSMTKKRDHNLWFGSNIPSCNGLVGEKCGINPQFVDYTNNDFSLIATSAAINTGATLDPTFGTALGNNISPAPLIIKRSGAWDMGAFEK